MWRAALSWSISYVFVISYVALVAAQAADITLLSSPVEVTATIKAEGDDIYAAQIGVHNGPIAQLVGTVVRGNNAAAVQNSLAKQVQWRSPYLLVHSSCGGGSAWNCDGEVVFKIANGNVLRLGDVIGTDVFKSGHFYDVYDKLENQVTGLSHAASPSFVLVLDEVDTALKVNADLTWSNNATRWRERADQIAAAQPKREWLDADWEPYFSAVVSNAALARYCNKSEPLQQLLSAVNPVLDAEHRRLLTDALSKVVPLEAPKAWRKPY
jgi:hypothetical protein